jgi:5'-3' exonuclease
MRPYIAKALSHLGVRQLTANEYEADDLAGFLVRKLSADPANEIGLISGDQDWLQLVRKNVFWRDMRDDVKQINATNFYDKTGCLSPFAFLECKILTGDTSDCISGVGGIGEKGAPEFIAEFGSVRNFWQQCASGTFVPKKKAHTNLATGPGRALYKRNFQLMQLLKVEAPPKSDTKLDLGKFDREAFANICGELAFTSILRNLDEYVAHFQ